MGAITTAGQAHAAALLDLSDDLLTVLDATGRVLEANAAWQRTLGWDPEAIAGCALADLMHPEDGGAALGALEEARDTGATATFAGRCQTVTGDWKALRWSVRGDGEAVVAAARDVTEESLSQQRALHDSLTGVPNRLLFGDRLAQALQRLPRQRGAVAVVFIDIDRFKWVNDSRGHGFGDALLTAVAARLSSITRAGDTVARIGGDEFVILADDVHDDGSAAAARVGEAFAEPFIVDGEAFRCTASVGVATTRDAATAPQELVHRADVAMYRAKAAGRATLRVYDAALEAEVVDRLSVEHELRHALARGELEVHYQPLVQLDGDAVIACEALLRWNSPVLGNVAPMRFVPLAEESGYILDLGLWVLEEACRSAREWRRQGRDVTVSVNVSPRQLADASFPWEVSGVLKRTGLPAQALCLELTETAMTTGASALAAPLGRLRAQGVRIAIDDFGEGFASLGYLKVLPVDVIKLAGPFVAGLERTDEDRAIVSAALALARTLGLTVVAEGVEHESTLLELRRLGVPFGQGFLFARPKAAEDLVLDGFAAPRPGLGDPYVIREFMRQIGIPARLGR